MIEQMFDKKEIEANEYNFGTNKTILHEAVLVSDSPELINCILEHKASVDAREIETGNTALFLAGIDLKVDIVRTLLKFNPDIKILNNNGQDIFTCLKETLIEKKNKGYSKAADLTRFKGGMLFVY